ncbi:MAG: hypothetical protein WAW75_05120 [Gallionella sp.]
MRELELDYQRKPSNITLLGAIVSLLAVAVMVLTIFQYRQVGAENEILGAKLRQIERASAPRSATTARRDTRALAEEVKQANQILRKLGLRWDSIFGAVAAAHREGVALLALAPEPDKRIVKINAEAKNFSMMLDYVKRLEDQPALGAVYLQSHDRQTNDPQRPVRFVVIADWLDE